MEMRLRAFVCREFDRPDSLVTQRPGSPFGRHSPFGVGCAVTTVSPFW
jgi:hypothetical protein